MYFQEICKTEETRERGGRQNEGIGGMMEERKEGKKKKRNEGSETWEEAT